MSSNTSNNAPKLEIAHILFADVVGFSKLTMEDQKQTIQHLSALVRETEPFHQSDEKSLITITTGDGFALVFFDDPEAPIKCARELGQRLRAEPSVKLRMGVHSGAVFRIPNLNGRMDVTGTGINMAQRVMDAGDDGHILASGAAANILAGLTAWARDFHELDKVPIKDGSRILIYNVYGEDYGNPEIPQKLLLAPAPEPGVAAYAQPSEKKLGSRFSSLGSRFSRRAIVASVLAAVCLIAIVFFGRYLFSGRQRYASLAIAPFGYEPVEASYLADELPDRLTLSFSEIPQKLVLKRTTKRIHDWEPLSNVEEQGRSLGVDAVLRGNLKKNGNDLVVDVKLVDVQRRKVLWEQTYPKKSGEVSTIEQDIAHMVVQHLGLDLTATENEALRSGWSKDKEANGLYDTGLSLLAARDEDSLQKARTKFKEAVQKDSTFARAFAKLADAIVLLSIYGKSPPASVLEERMKEAETAASTALKLSPKIADAHVSLAYINFRYRYDWKTAEDEFKHAIRLDDWDAQAHNWYGDFLEAMGRFEDALAQKRRAVEISPDAIWVKADLGLAYCYADQLLQAVEQLNQTLALDDGKEPKRFAQTHNYLGLTYEKKGQVELAVQEYEKAVQLDPGNVRLKAILAHGYAISGQVQKWQSLVNDLNQVQLYYKALAFSAPASPGNKNRTLDLLESAVKNKEPGVVFLKIDPRLKSVHGDPRFDALVAKLNFPPPN